MGYCTTQNIQDEFKSLDFTSQSAMNATKVQRFINEYSAYMDAKIGLKYVLPITGPNSLLMLEMICIAAVSDRVTKITQVKSATAEVSQASKQPSDKVSTPDSMLKEIVDGTLLLSDATLKSTEDGVSSFNVENAEKPIFQKDTQQW